MGMANRVQYFSLMAAVCSGLWAVSGTPARAHPHVWITAEATVVYERDAIVGLRQKWTFDEFYTSMAIEGLDANNDGVFDRKELAELASVNMEGLKEFNYFTVASIGDGRPAAFADPKDYWLEYGPTGTAPGPAGLAGDSKPAASDQATGETKPGLMQQLGRALFGGADSTPPDEKKPKVLSLHFTLPFKEPVTAETEALTFSVADPTIFIWFDYAKENPIRMTEGAPKTCRITMGVPIADTAEVKRLNDAFMTQFAGPAGSNTSKTVAVQCPK